MADPPGVEDVIAIHGTRYYRWTPLDLAVCLECSAVLANDPQAIRKHYAWHARIDSSDAP